MCVCVCVCVCVRARVCVLGGEGGGGGDGGERCHTLKRPFRYSEIQVNVEVSGEHKRISCQ